MDRPVGVAAYMTLWVCVLAVMLGVGFFLMGGFFWSIPMFALGWGAWWVTGWLSAWKIAHESPRARQHRELMDSLFYR